MSYAGIIMPRGTPEPILARMEAACAAAMNSEPFRRAVAHRHCRRPSRPRRVRPAAGAGVPEPRLGAARPAGAARMRRLLLALAVLLAPGAAGAHPDRPITLISPYALSVNATIRALGDAMGRALGQRVVVVARDGGSGVVGMQVLAASMPDGHTLAYTAVTPLVVQPHLLPSIGYTGPASPASATWRRMCWGWWWRRTAHTATCRNWWRRRGGRRCASARPGRSAPQIVVERIRAAAGGDYEHVPFRGDQQPILETLAGRLDFAAVVVASAGEMLRTGRLRLLGVVSAWRHPNPGDAYGSGTGVAVVQRSFAGVHAPAGTPAPVLDRLEAACRVAVDDPLFRRVAWANGVVVDFRGRDEQDALLAELSAGFASLLHGLGVRRQ
ncbi:tripartite tricarboxylate transporter substrate-binding protein [Siccirubricoccus deserti]